MPYKTEKMTLPRELDRRVKVTDEDRAEIRRLHKEGVAIREIARRFEGKTSRRNIQYILFPERLAENRKRREERGGWRQYYDKETHRKQVREHRRYKHKVLTEKND